MGQSTRKYDLINDFNNLKKTGGFDSGGGVGCFTFWQNFISNLQELLSSCTYIVLVF